MKGLEKVRGWVRSVCGRSVTAGLNAVVTVCSGALVAPLFAAMGILGAMASSARAQSADLIPESPVDMVELIGEVITKMGLVVGAAIGAWAIYLIIRKALRWIGRAF